MAGGATSQPAAHDMDRVRERRAGIRLFASSPGAPADRRLVDAFDVAAAVVALVVLGAWAIPARPFERSLAAFAASSPAWLGSLWTAAYWLALVPPLAVPLAALVRRRFRVAALAALAALVALGLALAAADALGTRDAVEGVELHALVAAWPPAALAVVGAATLALGPELVVPARRFGAWLLVVAAGSAVLAARASPTGVVAGLLVAIAAGGIARLALGTAAGRLGVQDVERMLSVLGLGLREVGPSERTSDGVLALTAVTDAGAHVVVKVYGRDAAESRLAARAWRRLWYRDGSGSLALPRGPGLRAEALATLLAAARGAPVRRVELIGRPNGGAEVLVLHAAGAAASDGGFADAGGGGRAWTALDALHAAGYAHLSLSPHALVALPDGTAALTDLTDAVLAPDDAQLALDDAQLLVTLAVLAGVDTAIEASLGCIDAARAQRLVAYLQSAALPAETRRAARQAGTDVDAVRDALVAAAALDEPELARLRRVSLGSIVQAVLLVFAGGAIVTAFSGVDASALRSSVADASVGLLVAAFVVAQLPRLGQAVSTLGSVPARLPFGPVYGMQLATSFMNLALPSAVARMAALGALLPTAGRPVRDGRRRRTDRLARRRRDPGRPARRALPARAAGPRRGARRLQSQRIRCGLHPAPRDRRARRRGPRRGRRRAADPPAHPRTSPSVVAGRPRRVRPLRTGTKLSQLVGGNLVAELLFAAALALTAHAFGATGVSLVDALFVNLASSLVALVIPIPGGIGVAEATLFVGLRTVGVGEDAAFATTIAYRVATFYLPPLWGWFAMRWLTRHRYL